MGGLVTRIDYADTRSRAALGAEARLLELYEISWETINVQLPSTGARVRVTVSGSGDPLLILPGGAGEAFPYVPLIAKLKGWRCIAINRPGGGLSDGIDHRAVDLRGLAVEVVDTVMDTVGVERAALVCNSMGGLWGFWYALERSKRISALVELGCPALALGTSAPIFMRMVTVPGFGRAITSRMVPKSAADATVGLAIMGTPPEVINELPSAFAEAAHAMFNLPTYGDTWRTLLGAVTTVAGAKARYALTPQHLREVEQPVLLVWGTNDPFGTLSKAREAADLVPSSRLEIVGRGHMPFLEDPARCATLIRDHLNRGRATA